MHVGQHDMQAAQVREKIGPNRILGVSAQTVRAGAPRRKKRRGLSWRRARSFPHPQRRDAKPISHETLKAICQAVSIPVCAIGGISKENILELSGSGVDGVALVSAIFSNPDIESACRQLRALSEKMTER